MNKEAFRICEELDAAIFSGDTFYSDADLSALFAYLARWQHGAAEIKSFLEDKPE